MLVGELQQSGQAEPAIELSAAEIAGADLKGEIAALQVMRRQPALAGVLQTTRQCCAAIQGFDRRAAERAKAHARDIHYRWRPEGPSALTVFAKHLRARQRVSRVVIRVSRKRR